MKRSIEGLDVPPTVIGDEDSAESAKASKKLQATETLQLLLSLDVALEIIHADRESLKRVESFKAYPGMYGHRVRETIEEVFILMLQAMGERHISPGFRRYVHIYM